MKAGKGRAFWDILLIALLFVVSLASFLLLMKGREHGGYAVVAVQGKEIARYSLSLSTDVSLNGGTNHLKIEDGKAYLTDADCPDKLCVKQGRIQYTGQCITCLPNRLTVTIVGGDNTVDLVL